MGGVGRPHAKFYPFFKVWENNENEIAWKSHKQAFAEFSEPEGVGASVANGVVGKIYCPCREDPLSPAVGRMVLSGCGKRVTHLSGEK